MDCSMFKLQFTSYNTHCCNPGSLMYKTSHFLTFYALRTQLCHLHIPTGGFWRTPPHKMSNFLISEWLISISWVRIVGVCCIHSGQNKELTSRDNSLFSHLITKSNLQLNNRYLFGHCWGGLSIWWTTQTITNKTSRNRAGLKHRLVCYEAEVQISRRRNCNNQTTFTLLFKSLCHITRQRLYWGLAECGAL